MGLPARYDIVWKDADVDLDTVRDLSERELLELLRVSTENAAALTSLLLSTREQ